MSGWVHAFVVDGEPTPKARPRTITTSKGDVRTYTPKTTRSAEQVIGESAKNGLHRLGDFPVDTPVKLVVDVYVEKKGRGDLDNYVKTVMDALNGVIWKDDRQVEELVASINRHSGTGRLAIVVADITEAA